MESAITKDTLGRARVAHPHESAGWSRRMLLSLSIRLYNEQRDASRQVIVGKRWMRY